MYAVQVNGQTITRQWLRDQGAADIAAMIPGIADYDRAEFSLSEHAREFAGDVATHLDDQNVEVVEV